MVRIRLKRTGTRNLPCFRVVVVDQRAARDGRTIEEIGFYDPRHDEERLDLERYNFWIGRGAQPSKTAADLARRIANPEEEAKRKAEIEKAKKAEDAKKAEEAKKAAAEEAKKAEEAEKAAEEAKKAEEAEKAESEKETAPVEDKKDEPEADKAEEKSDDAVTEDKEEKTGE